MTEPTAAQTPEPRRVSQVRRTQRKELVKLTVFLAFSAVIGVYLFLVMGDVRPGDRTVYRATFADVSGLKPGDQVRVASVVAGTVKSVDVGADAKVQVSFDVESDIELNSSTTATVKYKNLVGDRYLALDRPKASGAILKAGALLPATQTKASLDLDTLLNGFKPLFVGLNPQRVNELSQQLVAVLQGQTGAIRTLLTTVGSVTSTIGDREQLVGQVVRNLNTVVGEVDTHRDDLDTLVTGLSDLVDGLEKQDTQVLDAAEQLSDFSNDASDLLTSARGDLTPTLENLTAASQGLNNQQSTLRTVLAQLPKHYTEIAQTSSYGNFFNFFLCGVRVQLTDESTGIPIITPWVNSDLTRCQRTEGGK